MPIETIEFKGKLYPKFQSEGFAAQFIFPVASKICKGNGYDIGCNRMEWALPGAMQIDPAIEGCQYDAMNLPPMKVDFIFSSHCLEHISDWVGVLNYWKTKLRYKGVCFLYLPHPEQEYWLPFNNRKHIHSLSPDVIEKYFLSTGWKNVFVTKGHDANHSFTAFAENI